MALIDVRTRVADMLARSDLDSQINDEISLAVAKYRRRMTHLTEVRDGIISTVATVGWYSTVDLTTSGAGLQVLTDRTTAPVSDIIRFQYMSLGTGNSPMREINYPEIRRLMESTASGGQPFEYARHSGAVGFWSVPNDVYTIMFSAFVRPQLPVADGSESVFFTEAQELIESCAAAGVASKFVRNLEAAAVFSAQETRAWADIKAEDAAKRATGRLTPRY